MKAIVHKDVCIGCGACTSIAEEVFELGDDGLAFAKTENVNDENKDAARDASESCPVAAIEIEE